MVRGATTRTDLLVSLAILRANWDESDRTYVDSFVPFALEAIRSQRGEPVDAELLRAEIINEFGISVPLGVADTLLRRAAHAGYGVRDHGRLLPNAAKLNQVSLTARRDAATRQIRALVERLRSVSSERFSRHLSEPEAQTALMAHIDTHSVSLLRSMTMGRPYQPSLGFDNELDHIVTTFVSDVLERDPTAFDYLQVLVQGSMIASTLYLPNLTEVDKRFEHTTALFDTRVLLQALGFEGTDIATAMKETFDTAYELGAKLACFQDTLNEVRGVLYAAGDALRRPKRGAVRWRSVESHFRDSRYSRSDVELIVQGIDARLRDLRIKVMERPAHDWARTVDEQAMENSLRANVSYTQEAALRHDLNALTAIHLLRDGSNPIRFENCKAVFVTTNSAVARSGNEFLAPEGIATWPVAMLDHDFATLVWLKRPLRAPNLPRLRIIADCYASMEPSAPLWEHYVREIERLQDRGEITDQDYYILRFAPEARNALMDRTFGDPRRVTSVEVESILADARKGLTREIEDRLVAEQMRSSAEIQQVSDRAAAAETRFENVNEAERRRIRRNAVRLGRVGSTLMGSVLGIVVLASAWAALPPSIPFGPSSLPRDSQWIGFALLLLWLGIAVLSRLSSFSVFRLARLVDVRVATWAERRWVNSSEVLRHLTADAPSE